MANTRVPGGVGRKIPPPGVVPPRTPGPLGLNDRGDCNTWSLAGDTPGAAGINDHGTVVALPAQSSGANSHRVLPTQGDKAQVVVEESANVLLLASVAYGESSSKNVYEEIAAIANVIVRQKDARSTTLAALLSGKSTYAFAASDGNKRTAAFRKATPVERTTNDGMAKAIKAAHNALDEGGSDYSEGAYFWDGADIKTNYDNHPKVKAGIKFTDVKHNIYEINESSVNVTIYWQISGKDGKLTNGKVRGTYTYTYESTTAFGGTIFWKYGDDFIKATGNKLYK